RQHAAWLFELALSRSALDADQRRVAMDCEPAGAGHGALLRRRHGRADAGFDRARIVRQQLWRRRAFPRTGPHAAARRAGAWPRRHASGLLGERGVLIMRAPACLVALALVAALAVESKSAARRFLDDDPIAREPDTQDASGVAEWEIDLTIDLAINLFAVPGDSTPGVRARNVNTIDEVPDSSWFTNRI